MAWIKKFNTSDEEKYGRTIWYYLYIMCNVIHIRKIRGLRMICFTQIHNSSKNVEQQYYLILRQPKIAV